MEEYMKLYSAAYEDFVLGSVLPEKWWAPLPHFYKGWLRNAIGATLFYLICGALWCFYIYHLKRNLYVRQENIPSRKAMLMQIGVSLKAMPWYSALPTITEHIVARGWTKCFSSISDVGWVKYFGYVIVYLLIVEFGMYWIHRELHHIKPLYKHLHAPHHIYNKQNTLSPFAGFAFHPLDGILQALPHVIALFIVPTHFATHVGLLFIDGVWTTNIHDCIHGKVWSILGAGHHTIHHTTYRHNYGHYTIWMDWMFGTLSDPGEGDDDQDKMM